MGHQAGSEDCRLCTTLAIENGIVLDKLERALNDIEGFYVRNESLNARNDFSDPRVQAFVASTERLQKELKTHKEFVYKLAAYQEESLRSREQALKEANTYIANLESLFPHPHPDDNATTTQKLAHFSASLAKQKHERDRTVTKCKTIIQDVRNLRFDYLATDHPLHRFQPTVDVEIQRLRAENSRWSERCGLMADVIKRSKIRDGRLGSEFDEAVYVGREDKFANPAWEADGLGVVSQQFFKSVVNDLWDGAPVVDPVLMVIRRESWDSVMTME